MKHASSFAAAPLAVLLALSACNTEPETIVAGDDDPQRQALQNAAPIEAPPMIQANRTYRCKDNSLVYAEFYTNNTVKVRTERDGAPTTLTAGEGGQPPYTAEGWSLSANAAQISLTAPGKGTRSCRS